MSKDRISLGKKLQTGRSTGLDRSNGRLPIDRSISDRPAGPVRSDLFGPVPVVKNPDRFPLWCIESLNTDSASERNFLNGFILKKKTYYAVLIFPSKLFRSLEN